jgi:hypothetical protein
MCRILKNASNGMNCECRKTTQTGGILVLEFHKLLRVLLMIAILVNKKQKNWINSFDKWFLFIF